MAFKTLLSVILILILFVFVYQKNLEYFQSLATQNADPLQLNKKYIYNPENWTLVSKNPNVYKSTIAFTAVTGQIDVDNIIAVPSLQSAQSSGLTYQGEWNRLQGENLWHFAPGHQAGHGSTWFRWDFSEAWKASPEDQKRTRLIIDVYLTPSELPADNYAEFPVMFQLTLPDFNYSRSQRANLVLTHNPIMSIDS